MFYSRHETNENVKYWVACTLTVNEELRNICYMLINLNIVFEIFTLLIIILREKNKTTPELLYQATMLGKSSPDKLFAFSEKAISFF